MILRAGAPGSRCSPHCWRAAARRSGRTSSDPMCRGSRLAGPFAPAGDGACTAGRRGPDDEWWQVFNDPALDAVVAEAQRSNPSVRVAGARIIEARAQLGIAGSGLYPQLQQLNGEALWVGQDTSDGPAVSYGSYGLGIRHRLGDGFLGQVPARHRGGGCELLRQHRAVRRRAGAGRRPGRQFLHLHPHDRAAAAHCARERRPAEAQPRDHRAAVRERQRIRTRRAAGEDHCTSARSRPSPNWRVPCARRRTR